MACFVVVVVDAECPGVCSAPIRPKKQDDLKIAFKRFDLDGDGNISCQELGLVLTDICPDVHLASEQIEQLLRAIDADGDRAIDFEEFMKKLTPLEISLFSTKTNYTQRI